MRDRCTRLSDLNALDTHADVVHTPGGHAHWSESFYFNFYDRAKDLCGFMRIGLKPNLSLKEMLCYFMMPDGSVVGLKDSVPFDWPALTAKGLRFDMLEPERRWRVSFVGGMERTTERKAKKSHVELDLQFDALNDIFDYRACVSGLGEHVSKKTASEHLEQVGRLKGRLSTGLDEFEIDALGERDHSWGTRDSGALKGWTWLTCQFSESHALNLTKLVTEEGTVDAGFVFLDGRNIPVVRADMNVNMDFGKNPMSFDMTLPDVEGGAHRVFASVMKRVGVHFKSADDKSMATMNETLTRYTAAGKNGYGIAEFLAKAD
jgi:hypothetical protein